MSTVSQEQPFEWAPHIITNVECFNEPRTGFIGRALAVRQLGMEFIIVAKNAEELDLVSQNFLGFETDAAYVYKATVINSAGVEIAPMPEDHSDLEVDPVAVAALADEAGLPDPVTTTPVDDDDEL